MLRRIVVLCALFVIVSFPALALRHERPAAFGWHMFVAVKPPLSLELTSATGAIDNIPLSSITAYKRPEVNYQKTALTFVCKRNPNVVSVRLIEERKSGAVEKARKSC